MNEIKYRGFIIEYVTNQTLTRENNGEKENCKGASYTVFTDESKMCIVDMFTAAVGYELPDDSNENTELFAREMVDMQYKQYLREKEVFKNGVNL